MSARNKALHLLHKNGSLTSQQLALHIHSQRAYAQRILHDLVQEGLILKVGVTRGVCYVPATEKNLLTLRTNKTRVILHLRNHHLDEAAVFERIEKETGILRDVPKNIRTLFEHGFTEMLNNAIDHSQSEMIDVVCQRSDTALTFSIRDFGIGVFNNVQNTFRLPGTLAAIQELLKGKRTTNPENHTGLGIFFTSKMADIFIIDSFEKTLTVNNLVRDVFISDRKSFKGTRVSFSIHLASTKTAKAVYDAYTTLEDDDFSVNKTRVSVKLFEYGNVLPSRSEAKRVMLNLENFKEVELDFSGVETVGQGFADQIFRVWHNRFPETHVFAVNTNENIAFVIRAAGGIVDQERLPF